MPEAKAVNTMFSGIAGRYDFANHLLSGGLDYGWRKKLVRAVAETKPSAVADLACGSGDVTFALRRELGTKVQIQGLDFCQPMLDEAVSKKSRKPEYQDLTFSQGDCLALTLDDESVDAVTISFGLRNLEDRHKGLCEMHRILKPGGALFVLEFSQPYGWFKPIYFPYLKYVLPRIAALATGDKGAYDYLGCTIESFPKREDLSEELQKAGFNKVEAIPLTFGSVALHIGRR